MTTIDQFLDALRLESIGDGRFVGQHLDQGHGVVFGGQLLAQTLVAAVDGVEGKSVKTLHTVFARGASYDAPAEIAVETVHDGRSFGSRTVTISQGDRVCTTSTVLLTADEPDLIRHADPMPDVQPPAEATPNPHGEGAWEIRTVDDVDINDPELVGPPDLDVWTRFAGAPDDPVTSQALLAFASDGFLIGTAMRPHEGIGQAQAHKSLATGVVGHTITFHDPFQAGDWMLLAHHSPHAGGGRCYGQAQVFTEQGQLVASYVQDAMIRAMPQR